MTISEQPLDKAYFEFFINFYKTLQYTPELDRVWTAQKVREKIEYILGAYMDDFINTTNIPEDFNSAEYSMIEETHTLLPPACVWVSKSGRFSCHDLSNVLSVQAYILWDTQRRVVSPLLFSDLVGMDEENDVFFCRTLNVFHFGDYDSPLRINVNWINMPHHFMPFPNDYKNGEFYLIEEEQKRALVERDILNLGYKENDICNFYFLPDFEELLNKTIQVLLNKDSEEQEENKLVKKVISHPDAHELFNEQVLSDILSKYTKNSEVHDIMMKKFFPDLGELPF